MRDYNLGSLPLCRRRAMLVAVTALVPWVTLRDSEGDVGQDVSRQPPSNFRPRPTRDLTAS